jgi:predicted dehydrogenase
MEIGVHPDDGGDIPQVARLTDGVGADGVIITAATSSDAVVSNAFRMCRKKGRVVLVGDVGLNLDRADFFEKELDFFISTSYGPGRYHRAYEEEGLDYPVGYVRWTENRNMAEYLRLLAEGKLNLKPLVSATYTLEQAADAYAALESHADRPLMVLLSYLRPVSERLVRQVIQPGARAAVPGAVRIAVVGAGSFARDVHLPNLKKMPDQYYLKMVMSRGGDSAMAAARRFGAASATTDYQQVLSDPDIQAVLITTRHNLHTGMTLNALRAGKHVLVEKPLALTRPELEQIQSFYAKTDTPILLTGFNRRFSRYAQQIRALIQDRHNPMILNYRMNAGYLPPDHWVYSEEGGGRNLGEACHIYDLLTYLTNSRVAEVWAFTIHPRSPYYTAQDNFTAILTFEDGSLAALTYTALGSTDYPKEYLEVFVEGKVIVLNDYRTLTTAGVKIKGISTPVADKGHREELVAFARAIQQGGDWPIPLWQQIQATEIALRVEEQIKL